MNIDVETSNDDLGIIAFDDEQISFEDYMLANEELNMLNLDIQDKINKIDISITTSELISRDISNESASLVMEMVDYEVSTEANVNVVETFKKNLSTLYNDLNKYIFKQFKSFAPLVKLTTQYKRAELENLKKQIEDGTLVPKKSVDQKKLKVLNNKLGVFYASGYSLKKNANDLATFIDGMYAITNKSGRYISGLIMMYNKLSANSVNLDIPKLNGVLNVKKSLNGLSDTAERKIKITDFRLSIINKYISSNVNILFVANAPKRGIRVYVEPYKVNLNQSITPPDTKSAIKLLDSVIKNSNTLNNVHKNLGFNIKMLTRDNTLQLISSISGENKSHRFLIAKYSESVTMSLINLYNDILATDKLVIDYINTTFEKGSKKA